MNYDAVHALAKELSQCDEAKEYMDAREKVLADQSHAAFLCEYKKLSIEAQAHMISKGQAPEELLERIQSVYSLLMHDDDCMDYLLAEHKINAVISEVFRILSEAVDLELGFLET